MQGSSTVLPLTQRYRLTDRFTPDELRQLVARYQAGEMSTTLAREQVSPNRHSSDCSPSMASAPDLAA